MTKLIVSSCEMNCNPLLTLYSGKHTEVTTTVDWHNLGIYIMPFLSGIDHVCYYNCTLRSTHRFGRIKMEPPSRGRNIPIHDLLVPFTIDVTT